MGSTEEDSYATCTSERDEERSEESRQNIGRFR